MTSRQTVASKGFNSHYIGGGIIKDYNDEDGDVWRGCAVTGEGETTDNNIDICAAGEGAAGVVVSFPPQYEIDLDSANDTANRVCAVLLKGSAGECYTYHDAAATDALTIGIMVSVETTGGYSSIAGDVEIDHLGLCQETLSGVTTSYLAFKVLI